MPAVLVDLGFKIDVDISDFKEFSNDEIEFLICANKDIDTRALRKKIKNFKLYIFEPTLYINDEDEIRKLKNYFLKNTNSSFLISYDEFEPKKIKEKLEEIRKKSHTINKDIKPKLAFFSPIPNEKTGVSLYSEELLERLNDYYKLTVIVENLKNVRDDLKKKYDIKEVDYFFKNADSFDRIVYQMGGSSYHLYMYDIMKKFEGIVVFHDFYMSQLFYHKDLRYTDIFYDELYYSHGYHVFDFLKEHGLAKTILNYPANLSLIDYSLGIITHSNEPKRIFDSLYGGNNDIFENIPLLRKPAKISPKSESRKRLNLPENKFIISTFGYIGSTKLTLEAVEAFAKTTLYTRENSILLLVGEGTSEHYMNLINRAIKDNLLDGSVKFIGWTSDEEYREYLSASDVAIQLRIDSRGETSAAVLDCFNYSLATIINNHGSMKDLPRDCAYFIDEKFSTRELASAIERICKDYNLRENISKNAKEHLDKNHNPSVCAKKYFEFIEKTYAKKPVLKEIVEEFKSFKSDLIMLSKAISSIKKPIFRQKTIFIDITEVYINDLKTGIQRVVKAQLLMLITICKEYRIEPVYYNDSKSSYFYARDFMKKLYKLDEWNTSNEIVDIHEGDIFYGIDYMPVNFVRAYQKGVYNQFRAKGVKLFFVLYDNIPLSHPHFFPPEVHINHERWLKCAINCADGFICISDSVVNDLKKYILDNSLKAPAVIESMKLGHDIRSSNPILGIDDDSRKVLKKIIEKPTFIMVGTVEPRKGHDAAIAAFDALWQRGLDINLVIVGKMGWMVNDLFKTVDSHSERGKRLIYLNFVSDETLEEIYKSSSCLIAASRAEGFGLPIVEAAVHKIPIIARDLEVFREVSNDSATFFKRDEDLADVISKWLDDFKALKHIKPDGVEIVSWRDSAMQAYKILTGDF
ncbi:glycosyltransferase [Campylobacter sp. RM16189]|uniref:glycosyltransferase n=1 Tax=Campylobacter sp. RM16189 TaxID=1705726 RepID=UPI00147643A2|nr:glycosyltransferase [Campylobacter sp. RM16189]